MRFTGSHGFGSFSTFGEVADYKKGPFGSALKKEIFVPKSINSIKVYEQQNAIEKDWRLERYFITKEYSDKLSGFHVEPGDVIVSCAGTIGEIYELPSDAEHGVINQALMRVRVHCDVDKNWFLYAFSNMISAFSAKYSNGSAIKNIPPFADLKRYKLFLPAIDEQRKVGCFLSLIDKRIEVQNKIIEERESSIKTLFLSLDEGAKQKICLCDVGEYRACDNLSWDEIGVTGRPAIIYGELFTAYRYLINTVHSQTTRNLKSISTGNDILFPSSTTVDAISLIAPAALMRQGVALGGDMFSIAVKDDIDPIYLSFLINCRYKKALSKYAQGSTIIHLHYEDIKCFPLELVPLQKQKSIGKVMASYLKAVEIEKEELSLLLKQKEYLLKSLFI